MIEEYDKNEDLFPHSPDVAERETADGGFSSGWGMHFKPTEKAWMDVHSHIQMADAGNTEEAVTTYLKRFSLYKVSKFITCLPKMVTQKDREAGLDSIYQHDVTGLDELEGFFRLAEENSSIAYYLRPNYTNPDLSLLEAAYKRGIYGVKLHNAEIIVDGADPEVWLSKSWAAVFERIQELGLPILWHVTQRLTDSPYTDGGRNTYWKDGWLKGIKYTNEDLLQIYLKIVGRYPGIKFISAHQLHLGWERLTGLMDRYSNLYVDTTIGCQVRKDDRMYEADRQYLRSIFIKYADRLIYGTDIFITDGYMKDSSKLDEWDEIVCMHMRFIRQLDLPDEVLQKVTNGNAELVFNK